MGCQVAARGSETFGTSDLPSFDDIPCVYAGRHQVSIILRVSPEACATEQECDVLLYPMILSTAYVYTPYRGK